LSNEPFRKRTVVCLDYVLERSAVYPTILKNRMEEEKANNALSEQNTRNNIKLAKNAVVEI